MAMRLHITLDDGLVAELDRRLGPRERSAFIAAALRGALNDARRWDDIEKALSAPCEQEHDWDPDPAAWVRDQRREDRRRVG